MLNSTATVMSEAVVAAAAREGASMDKGGGRVGNGDSAGKPPLASMGVAGEVTSVSAAGVQTTPSVNGTAEMNRLK